MSLKFRLFFRRVWQAAEKLTAVQIITSVFVLIILAGAAILTLPAASKTGQSTPFLTALFTATSCTCVTGLSLVDTFTHWSFFGQAVMLVLIQIGGLGFMTVLMLFCFALHRRIGLKERMVIAQSFGLDKLSGVVGMVRKVLLRTFVIESLGMLVLTIHFARQMSFKRALWCGVFHAVSAFCNAGFDIFGAVEQGGSLVPYVSDVTVNLTLMVLIVVGGLGFFVWEDLLSCKKLRRLSVYSKLVLTVSAVLIFGGAAIFALLEWNNPATLGAMKTGEKLLAALFQSVTVRTAGFCTVEQAALSDASLAVTDFLMFVGGGSGSTAGGAKMITVTVLLLSVWATACGRSKITAFSRTVDPEQIKDAVSVVFLMFAAAFVSALILCVSNGLPMQACLYETISAIATVGLTTGITGQLNAASQIILIVLMFFGRVGIMTISLSFLLPDSAKERYHYAYTKVLIG